MPHGMPVQVRFRADLRLRKESFFYVCMFFFINRVSSGRGYNHTRENISFLPVTGLGNSIFTALKSKLSSGVQSGL